MGLMWGCSKAPHKEVAAAAAAKPGLCTRGPPVPELLGWM